MLHGKFGNVHCTVFGKKMKGEVKISFKKMREAEKISFKK
jgi:hypothetical protein